MPSASRRALRYLATRVSFPAGCEVSSLTRSIRISSASRFVAGQSGCAAPTAEIPARHQAAIRRSITLSLVLGTPLRAQYRNADGKPRQIRRQSSRNRTRRRDCRQSEFSRCVSGQIPINVRLVPTAHGQVQISVLIDVSEHRLVRRSARPDRPCRPLVEATALVQIEQDPAAVRVIGRNGVEIPVTVDISELKRVECGIRRTPPDLPPIGRYPRAAPAQRSARPDHPKVP